MDSLLQSRKKRSGNTLLKYIQSNEKLIIEVISALFILLFLYTAITKSIRISNTVYVLRQTPFARTLANEIAWAIVGLEYLVSVLLFVEGTRKIGLYTSFVLMLAFTTYITYMIIFIPDLPCSCGGVISRMSWNQHLIFNIVLSFLALTGILLEASSRRKKKNEANQIVFT